MRNTFAETMLEVGLIDPKLVVLVGDISHFALQPFAQACPGRFYNVGICEPTIVSMSAGLSHVGFHPVAHTIAPFLIERSFEQIKLDFCYQERGGNLISVGSAFDYSGLGVSHYCHDDIALIKALPRTQIVYPAMPNEFKILFEQTYKNDYLTYFRLPDHKHNYEIPNHKIKFGEAVVVQEGTDITIVVIGPQLGTVMESIQELKQNQISAEVLYYPTIKPFDSATLVESVSKTKNYIVIEEHSEYGGIGDDVIRAVKALDNIHSDAINIPNEFSHNYGNYKDQCEYYGFTSPNIKRKIKILLEK
ncbi:MAG: hypothetical protein HQ507_05330 [Candidatus Marinimicrobia bacterium]|nr:hypothetical protein [Candidatus Neomarinimicrobiota bacterium]